MDTTSTLSPRARRDTSPGTIVGQLNIEWNVLLSDRQANAVVGEWAVSDPALTGLTSLELIQEAAGDRSDQARADAIFAALIVRAGGGGPGAALAARTLTQMMLPKAILIARTCARELNDNEEQLQLAICALYDAIRSFPARRRKTHIAAHLAWDTHHAVRRAAGYRAAEIAHDCTHQWEQPEQDANPSEELARLLAWAIAQQVITPLDARLLAARYGSEDPSRATWKTIGNLTLVAAETGLSMVAARQRCSRATRKLARAVAACS